MRKASARAARRIVPAKILSTAEWAQEHLKLPDENADIPGDYDLDYAPYLFGIFAALDDPLIPEVVCMKAAQVGWTMALIAFLGKNIDNTPCPMIVMMATDGAAKLFSDEKFKPVVEATPRLEKHIDVGTSRRQGQRTGFRKFPGGFLKLVSSATISDVKSTPARIVAVEEPDDAVINVGGQGDSVKLLYERTKRMRRAKRVLGGTPSVKGFSRVESHLALTDKRVLPVVCHRTIDGDGCGEAHVLDFANVNWLEGDETMLPHEVWGRAQPETAAYVCPHCAQLWDDYTRKANIKRTVYDAIEAGDPLCGWEKTAESSTNAAGFMELNELYSCLPGAGLQELVEDYLEAEWKGERGDQSDRIVFQNSKLGRAYEYLTDATTAEALRERYTQQEGYAEFFCPRGGLKVSLGVDVQHDRLALQFWATGRDEEMWLLYWGEIAAADTCVDKNDPVYDSLEELILRPIEHELGGQVQVEAVSIDAGDGATSDAVYHFVRSRTRKPEFKNRVTLMAIKGSSALTDPEIYKLPTARSVDHENKGRQRTKAAKRGVKVYQVGTNKAKDWITEHFKLQGDGPGRIHVYPTVRTDFFDQVTSEVKVPHKTVRNRKVYQLREGVRNEGLDCFVYALHAARALRVHLLREADWKAAEVVASTPVTRKAKRKVRRQQRRDDSGGWIKGTDNWLGDNDR